MDSNFKVHYDHQIFTEQEFGGISRYFVYLSEQLRLNYDIQSDLRFLYTRNGYLDTRNHILSKSIGEVWLKKYRRYQKWNKKYSLYCIKKGDFDVFHPTYYHPYFLSKINKPYVVTVHDMIHEVLPAYFQPDDPTSYYKKQIIEQASHIIAISENTKKDIQRILAVPDEKITVIYHSLFQMKEKLDLSINQMFPKRDAYLLYVGARKGYKNFDKFLVAVEPLLKRFDGLSVLCVGGGEFKLAEQMLMKRLNITDKVRQVYANNYELKQYYRNALCFIYPSLYEGFGLPILEAFDSNCPVVVSKTSCFIEIGGDAAEYFDPYEPEDIRQTILKVLESNEIREQMKDKGQKRLEQFGPDKCLSKTAEVYDRFR